MGKTSRQETSGRASSGGLSSQLTRELAARVRQYALVCDIANIPSDLRAILSALTHPHDPTLAQADATASSPWPER